jgi:hypothetical protein
MGLPVRYTGDGCVEGLGFTIVLEEPLPEGAFDNLRRLLESWYQVGFYGGFGGTGFHDMMSLDYDEDDLMVSWTVDMGDVIDTEAVDVLARALEGFSQPTDDGPLIKLKELVVGHIVEE